MYPNDILERYMKKNMFSYTHIKIIIKYLSIKSSTPWMVKGSTYNEMWYNWTKNCMKC